METEFFLFLAIGDGSGTSARPAQFNNYPFIRLSLFFFFLSICRLNLTISCLSCVCARGKLDGITRVIVRSRWQATVDVQRGRHHRRLLLLQWCNNNNSSSSSSSSCGVEAEAAAEQVRLSIVSRFKRMTVRMMDKPVAVIIETETFTAVVVTRGRIGLLLQQLLLLLLDLTINHRLPSWPGHHPSKRPLSDPPCARHPPLPQPLAATTTTHQPATVKIQKKNNQTIIHRTKIPATTTPCASPPPPTHDNNQANNRNFYFNCESVLPCCDYIYAHTQTE